MRALRLFNLGANVLLVTVRTIPVTELRLGSLFDIAFDRLPLLRGIANPICAYCKRIRDASEQWESIERYVEERSEAQFSHGYCPDCYEKYVRPQIEKP